MTITASISRVFAASTLVAVSLGLAACGGSSSNSSSSAASSPAAASSSASAAPASSAAAQTSSTPTMSSTPAATSSSSLATGTGFSFTLPDGWAKDTANSSGQSNTTWTNQQDSQGVNVASRLGSAPTRAALEALLKKMGVTKVAALPDVTVAGEKAMREGGLAKQGSMTSYVQMLVLSHKGRAFAITMTDTSAKDAASVYSVGKPVLDSWKWTN